MRGCRGRHDDDRRPRPQAPRRTARSRTRSSQGAQGQPCSICCACWSSAPSSSIRRASSGGSSPATTAAAAALPPAPRQHHLRTAHRKFAVTINLNAEEYEAGTCASSSSARRPIAPDRRGGGVLVLAAARGATGDQGAALARSCRSSTTTPARGCANATSRMSRPSCRTTAQACPPRKPRAGGPGPSRPGARSGVEHELARVERQVELGVVRPGSTRLARRRRTRRAGRRVTLSL